MNWTSDKMSNGQPNTVRETFLQLELDRIRSTYSFRLGLVLTESIIRKPWMILFLPLTFLKMNFEYFRDMKNSKLSEKDSATRAGSNCLMLITASEEGVSASERTISIAKSWLKQKGHKVVVVSTNENLTSMTIQGVSHYQIPDPKTHRDISTSEWNDTCANVVRGAIETHIPYAVVFDGTFPYRGILNALTISPHQKKIWLRPNIIDDEVVERVKGIFDVIIAQDEMSDCMKADQPIIIDNSKSRTPSEKILVATGYGRHQLRDKINKFVNKRLVNEVNHTFIFPKNGNIGGIPNGNVEFWDKLVDHSEFPDLKAAIISDDINLASTCCNAGVPTICLIESSTPPNVKEKLNRIADSGNLLIAESTDSSEINLYLNAIFDSAWVGEITQRATIDVNLGWQPLFDICID
jgi:hypothetical protein